MLSANIKLADKYDYLEEKFRKVYAWLRENDLEKLAEGRYDIDGDNIYAMVQLYTTGTPDVCRFESHENYFDVQMVVSGEESFGYCPREGLTVATPYNPKSDVMFYAEPKAAGAVILHAGDLIIVAPEDAHAPRRQSAAGACPIRKIVAKVHI